MAKFGTQHYNAIAKVFRDETSFVLPLVGPFFSDLADMFEKDNKQFNRNKFTEACGFDVPEDEN